MAHYLIDYENVHVSGLNGLNNLTADDNLLIFYSGHTDTLTFDLHKQLMETKATISYVKVETKTSNALDFQLSTYLGFLIATNRKDDFYIVSKDKGFGSVMSFWKNREVSLNIILDLTKNDVIEVATDLLATLSKVLTNKEERDDVIKIIDNYKSKQGINNALVKKYESKRGGEIYKMIKSFLAGKTGK